MGWCPLGRSPYLGYVAVCHPAERFFTGAYPTQGTVGRTDYGIFGLPDCRFPQFLQVRLPKARGPLALRLVPPVGALL